ncbi:DUF4377 domain-containing protein [Glaciimonas sp. GG7]
MPDFSPFTFARRLSVAVAAATMLAACAGPAQDKPVADDIQLLSSRWELTNWPNHVIPNGENGEPVILNFSNEKGEGRVSGRAWCNQFTAPFSLRGPGQLTIIEAVTTRMACAEPAMLFEGDFLDKLLAVNHYRITGKVLEMHTVDGKILTFHARDKVGATAKIRFIYVAAEKAPCNAGVMKANCYQIREDKKDPWQLRFGEIVGFTAQPGIEYRLRILEERLPDRPADAGELKWTLDMVVEQEVVKYRK